MSTPHPLAVAIAFQGELDLEHAPFWTSLGLSYDTSHGFTLLKDDAHELAHTYDRCRHIPFGAPYLFAYQDIAPALPAVHALIDLSSKRLGWYALTLHSDAEGTHDDTLRRIAVEMADAVGGMAFMLPSSREPEALATSLLAHFHGTELIDRLFICIARHLTQGLTDDAWELAAAELKPWLVYHMNHNLSAVRADFYRALRAKIYSINDYKPLLRQGIMNEIERDIDRNLAHFANQLGWALIKPKSEPLLERVAHRFASRKPSPSMLADLQTAIEHGVARPRDVRFHPVRWLDDVLARTLLLKPRYLDDIALGELLHEEMPQPGHLPHAEFIYCLTTLDVAPRELTQGEDALEPVKASWQEIRCDASQLVERLSPHITWASGHDASSLTPVLKPMLVLHHDTAAADYILKALRTQPCIAALTLTRAQLHDYLYAPS